MIKFPPQSEYVKNARAKYIKQLDRLDREHKKKFNALQQEFAIKRRVIQKEFEEACASDLLSDGTDY